MAELKSRSFELGETIKDYATMNSKMVMPVNGIAHIWYGKFTGTAAQLKLTGIPIPAGKLIEPWQTHDGIISMVSASGTINMHEVS